MTDFFFRGDASDINPSTPDLDKLMALGVRGAGAATSVTNTNAGPINEGTGLQVTSTAGGAKLRWFTNPLSAVTISSTVTINVRGLESNAMANASLTMRIDRMNNAGTSVLSTIVAFAGGGDGAEFGTTESARNYTVSPTSATLSDGDRLRFQVFLDDASGVTMGSGFTVSFFYDGPTAGASGDSFVTFTETITEQGGGAPAEWLGQNRYARMRYGRIG